MTVTDGVVHLWGMVPTQAELDAARAAAESVGASLVESHLRVVVVARCGVAPAASRTPKPSGSTS